MCCDVFKTRWTTCRRSRHDFSLPVAIYSKFWINHQPPPLPSSLIPCPSPLWSTHDATRNWPKQHKCFLNPSHSTAFSFSNRLESSAFSTRKHCIAMTYRRRPSAASKKHQSVQSCLSFFASFKCERKQKSLKWQKKNVWKKWQSSTTKCHFDICGCTELRCDDFRGMRLKCKLRKASAQSVVWPKWWLPV